MWKFLLLFITLFLCFQICWSLDNSTTTPSSTPTPTLTPTSTPTPSSTNDETIIVDYLILGAGTAGSIVAGKLSEDKNLKVLLVESGPWDTNPWIYNISDWTEHWVIHPEIYAPNEQIQFPALPEPHLDDRHLRNLRGKVAGGCSSTNGMIALTCDKSNYEKWTSITGMSHWSWDTMRGNIGDLDTNFHFTKLSEDRVFMPQLKSAIEYIGYKYIPDQFHTATMDGFGTRLFMFRTDANGTMTRESPYSQYVKDKRQSRPNLDVKTGWSATKLEYGKQGDNSTFVKGCHMVLADNRSVYVQVKKEVIVSMGTYETPKFLQLNGIGNSTYLSSIGIKPVVDSPMVGQGLKDTLFMYYEGKKLVKEKEGVHIPYRTPVRDGYHVYGPSGGPNRFILSVDITSYSRFLCTVEPTQPKSTGYVRMTSNDSLSKPEIFVNYFSVETDELDYLDGIKECQRIQRHLETQGIIDANSTESVELGADDAAILKTIRLKATANQHACCSVRMGSSNTKESAVDGNLRVNGISNLRVVDASVFPDAPSGNPMIPVTLVALEAAKLIKS
eukprot:gene12841-15076_t